MRQLRDLAAAGPRTKCRSHRALRRYALPLQPLSCPVSQAFLNSIYWPVHRAYREALRVGDATTMLRIRLEVQRERSAWALALG